MQSMFEKPEGIYALSHSVGPMCIAAKESLHTQFIEPWQREGGDAWPAWLGQISEFTQQLGLLLNADAGDFCPQPSVSLAFSQWLAAIAKARGSHSKHVVVMHQDAFASLGFAVQGLCDTYQLELKLLSVKANDLDAWENALNQPDVLACLITHAHSNTGELSRVNEISQIAKKHNVYCSVDIAQSVGVIPIDLQTWQVDCVVGSCVKWLSGGPGAGFLYVPLEQASKLQPEHIAWFSHENPFEFDIRHFAPAKGVMRFFGGTPSIAPFVMAAAAIKQHNRLGTATFRRYNLCLMALFLARYPFDIPEHYRELRSLSDATHQYLRTDSKNIGQTSTQASDKSTLNKVIKDDALFQSYFLSDKNGKVEEDLSRHSATLCLPLPQAKAETIITHLKASKVKFDERQQVVRLSFGVINSISDLSKVLSCFYNAQT